MRWEEMTVCAGVIDDLQDPEEARNAALRHIAHMSQGGGHEDPAPMTWEDDDGGVWVGWQWETAEAGRIVINRAGIRNA